MDQSDTKHLQETPSGNSGAKQAYGCKTERKLFGTAGCLMKQRRSTQSLPEAPRWNKHPEPDHLSTTQGWHVPRALIPLIDFRSTTSSMNRCHLSDRLDHQMLSPILGSIEQLIEILSGQLLCKATKSAFDGALEDHFLLVVHWAIAAASILSRKHSANLETPKKRGPLPQVPLKTSLTGDPVQGNASHKLMAVLQIIEALWSSGTSGFNRAIHG